jgi:hypothetical protein
MRATVWMLALAAWLAPAVQVFAVTLADAHCVAHRHSSSGTTQATHASMHAHHQHEGANGHGHPAGSSGGHGTAHCACPCGLACGPAMALLPALPAAAFAASERAPALGTSLHAHAIHAVPQRPPTSVALFA